jgi:hypothetical protein
MPEHGSTPSMSQTPIHSPSSPWPAAWLLHAAGTLEMETFFVMTTKLNPKSETGQGLIEYIVGISIFLLLAAPVLYQIYVALAQKLAVISAQIAP